MKYIYVGRLPANICAKVSLLLAEESLKQAMTGNLEDAKDLIDDAISLERDAQLAKLEEEMEREER